MKITATANAPAQKLDLTVKAAGLLARAFVTPGMSFNKA
jgi:hypothetical protein